jgi:hypothetical protein
MSFIVKFCVTRHQSHLFQTFLHRLLRPKKGSSPRIFIIACVSFSELENDILNQAELNEIKINENN